MYKSIVLMVLVVSVRGQRDLDSVTKDKFTPQSRGDLDSVIKDIFTTQSQAPLNGEIKEKFIPRSQEEFDSMLKDIFTPRSKRDLDSKIKDIFTPRSQGNLDSKIKDIFTSRSQGNLDIRIKNISTLQNQGNPENKIKDMFTPRSQGNLDSKIKDIFTPRSQGNLDSKIKDIFTPRSQGNLDSKIKDIFTPRNQGNPENKIKDMFTPRQQGELALKNGSLKKEMSLLEIIFGPPVAGSYSDPSPSGTVPNFSDIETFPSVTGTANPSTISNGPGSNTGVNGINVFTSQGPTIIQPSISTETESCETDAGEKGECVRIFQCSNSTFNKDGAGIIDLRVRDAPCNSYLDICCLPNGVRAPNDIITPAPPTAEEAVRRSGCGWHNPKGVGIATIGDINNEAKFGEFPWMVALLKLKPIDQPDATLHVYVGGGSLIHPSVVLTAAHYVSGGSPDALRVRAGEWDTQTSNEIYQHQEREVKEIVTHENFNRGNSFYDVGLLFLSEPIEAAPHVSTACLPPPKVRALPGARCFASGWGKDIFEKEGLYQVILKRIEVPVVDRKTCQERLRKTRLGRYFELHVSFMCAGGERGKDTCTGDGGSPLVCPIDGESGRYVQNGIVAWGIGCGQDGTPGVYADVSVVRDWIDDKVAGRGFDPATYTY